MWMECNGGKMERVEFTFRGHLYRVTGTPSIQDDNNAMVDVLMPETTFQYSHHGYREMRHRTAYWRHLNAGPTYQAVMESVRNKLGRIAA